MVKGRGNIKGRYGKKITCWKTDQTGEGVSVDSLPSETIYTVSQKTDQTGEGVSVDSLPSETIYTVSQKTRCPLW